MIDQQQALELRTRLQDRAGQLRDEVQRTREFDEGELRS